MKKISKLWYLVGIIIIIAVATWIIPRIKKDAQIAFETEKVGKGTIQISVTATGTVEPVTEVTVGTQVSGIVNKLYVDYNSEVKKGQIIAELDKTNLVSTLTSAKASLESAQSSLEYEKKNFQRYQTLYEKGLVSADDYEQAKLSYDKAKESIVTAEENVKTAETNLGYATITSPIDGIVLSKAVEEGQTVAASFETPELFVIAQDLTDMQVVADVDEADIGEVREGERVTFTVDAYPNDVFEGEVTQVRQEAIEESNVITYEVVISAPNADLKLKPGLTASVTIYTTEKTDVLCVPSKALRFTPTDETVGKRKIVDTDGNNKLWTLTEKEIRATAVEIGITDGINTEILSGVTEGTRVVTEAKEGEEEEVGYTEEGNTEQSPFAPGPRRNDKKK